MPVLAWILLFTVGGTIGALTLSALILLLPREIRQALVPKLISYATGILLGAAFLGLLPHALEHAETDTVLKVVLAGLVAFFLLEKAVLWHHCHEDDHDHLHTHGGGTGQAGPLILIGDAFHSLTDGVIIAVAFSASIPVGIAASMAVIMHEIPHEVGDFAILLESGYSRKKAYLWNALSSLPAIPAALATYFWASRIEPWIPHLMALAAASFVYIALADLTPSLHRQMSRAGILTQTALLLLGIGTVAGLQQLLP